MSHSHEEEDEQEPNSPIKKLWFGLFVLMYPIIITFSMLFTGLLWIFSGLSWIISTVAKLLSNRGKTPANTSPRGLMDDKPEGAASTPVE